MPTTTLSKKAEVKYKKALAIKPTNTYVHADSKIKNKCRIAILNAIMKMFPLMETINTCTLGGVELMIEKMVSKYYKLKGLSYEFDEDSIELARKNAPKGIEIVEGDIFNHVYKGTEQFIWFDFMTALRSENIANLLMWLTNNTITNDCVFVVTHTLHSRCIKGEGYRQLFETEEIHDNFIDEMCENIGRYLENEFVGVEPNISVIRYCNTDVSKKSLPMVQFIFNLKKK